MCHPGAERQEAALCGRHCLNNLLQASIFTEFDLAEIAHELDARERDLMLAEGLDTADAVRFIAEDSGNVDESGNFSFSVCAGPPGGRRIPPMGGTHGVSRSLGARALSQVLNEALKRAYGITLVSTGADGEHTLDNPACVPSSPPTPCDSRWNVLLVRFVLRRAESGFVCNLENHWFAIRKLHGKWYNLNSLLKRPEVRPV